MNFSVCHCLKTFIFEFPSSHLEFHPPLAVTLILYFTCCVKLSDNNARAGSPEEEKETQERVSWPSYAICGHHLVEELCFDEEFV